MNYAKPILDAMMQGQAQVIRHVKCWSCGDWHDEKISTMRMWVDQDEDRNGWFCPKCKEDQLP